MNDFNNFLMGAIAVAYATASLFFARFWYRTGDRLFILFSIAFGLLSIIRIGLFALDESENHVLYWLRFAAYLLILLAIIDKNRGK